MALCAGDKLGPYEILAPIGAGGMGEVFRARDPRLGRDVAIKVLSAGMTHDADRLARFQREARAVAALNHPHIVTIFSVEEVGGINFLTMELVEGRPLDRLIPAGGLPVEQIVEIAGELADALAAAHDKGIVHRDLKPANVMVTSEGRVKVLDFGLAKEVGGGGPDDATRTSLGNTQDGMVMGTPAYMSPEQISGRPLDHRTDIFSLGVLLHEMTTGKQPFAGNSSAELISAILRDTPPSVSEIRPDLPGDLARIVRRCLEKDPRHRVQTARDVANEFRDMVRQAPQKTSTAVSAVRAVAAADSGAVRADEGFWVAVLPFKSTGASAEIAALADGLTEDIVTGLSRFSYLRVIARSSTLSYANKAIDMRVAGTELGARYVMEGSLRQAGSKLRLAVQLVDAVTGAHLWAENYERAFSPDALFELQDDLVPRIVSTVADHDGVLPQSMAEVLRKKSEEQLTPHEALLRSFSFFKHFDSEEHALIKRMLERAVQIAPENSDCWAILSHLHSNTYWGFGGHPDCLDRALAAARRAVDAGPSNHLSQWALALALFLRRDLPAFRVAAERAIELNRMDGSTVAFMGHLIAYSGDWERGCAIAEPASALNPNHAGWHMLPAFFNAYRKGEYKNALAAALRLNMPGYFQDPAARAAAYAQLGEREAAHKAVEELVALKPDFPATARDFYLKWQNPELVEHLIDGWRKAGLEIAPAAGAAAPAPSSGSSSVVKGDSGAVRADEGFWVAVLPFKSTGASVEIAALADGLTEEIVTGLSRFSYLRVIARGSTSRYASQAVDLRTIGKELGARYVMEGNLRQAGSRLRVAVQLVDAVTGAHLWAEAYDHAFTPESIFELQDDLVPRIVSTVADTYGVLPHSMSEALRSRADDQLTPHEAVIRSMGYFERITPEEHARIRAILERAVRQAPDQSDAWAFLSIIYCHEYAHGFNPQPNSLGRALAAARRSLDAAPSNKVAHHALATTLFFQKDFLAFRPVAQRVIELNRMDGSAIAVMGMLLSYAGDWDEGCALIESAMRLNPHHSRWYWFPLACNAYRKGDYRGALSLALKINMPGFFYSHAWAAAAYGQLGLHEPAQKALKELLVLRPDIATGAKEEFGKWYGPEFVEHIIDGLRKAGLQIATVTGTGSPAPSSGSSSVVKGESGAMRADEGFWVAVLPFKYSGTNADLTSLAEGLTEDIVTGLSRFSYLRVIARGSTSRFASQAVDLRTIGKEVGARYVMEGNLRQAGSRLRVAVQLVDAVTGAHLWAETYDRAFAPESIFELQDDLVPRIVSTVADQYGILPRSMSEVLRSKSEAQLTPHEAVLRAFSYFERVTPEEHAAVRRILEHAVHDAPDQADCLAMLSMIYRGEYAQGFNAQPDSLGRAQAAAQRAVDAAPSNHLAYYALATTLFFQKDKLAFRVAAERAIELNRMDGSTMAFLGHLMAASGDWEHGAALVESAIQLNPNHPGWYRITAFQNAYRKGEYREALQAALRINMPGYFHTHAARAAAYGQLGQREDAQKALKELLALRPDFATAARMEYGKWLSDELAEHTIDGLRKAGLDIPNEAKPAAASPAPAAQSGAHVVAGAAAATPSIAVLPFANLSAEKDQEYFSDGLAEEIINLLAHVSGLKVIARTSAFAFRGKEQDIRTIAETLGVETILQGSVRRAGSRIRVTVQLINAADGAHLWSERYDREMIDIFAIQDEISAAIAEQLKVSLTASPAAVKQTANVAAYEALLQARHHLYKFSPDNMARALKCLERALSIDPEYAAANSSMAMYYGRLTEMGAADAREVLPKARAAAQRALALDDGMAGAHAALGVVSAVGDYDWIEAGNHFRCALQLDRVSPEVVAPYAVYYLKPQGLLQEAMDELKRWLQRDPLSIIARNDAAWNLMMMRQYEACAVMAQETLNLEPNDGFSMFCLVESRIGLERYEEAIVLAEKTAQVHQQWIVPLAYLGIAYARGGRAADARRVLAEMHDLSAKTGYLHANAVAAVHVALGEMDTAADFLDVAINQREMVITNLKIWPIYDDFRSHPRYPALLKKMNLE